LTRDPAKAERNIQRHGVSFEQAREVFGDQYVAVRENVCADEEQRSEAIGLTGSLVLLLVIFVNRSEPEVEIIRIISARKANEYERSAYEDQFR
jgi:uncharacterized DUF497 family protein